MAVDTEFHAERRYLPRLYLVQLRLDDGSTWLVDPERRGHLEGIAAPLVACAWVVHGGFQDMRILLAALGALPERVLDTQIAASLVTDRFPAPYGDLVAAWLAVHVDKLATLSDWSRRPLRDRQLAYAAEDVQLLLPLWDRLAEEAETRGRTQVVAAACAEARERVVDPPAPELAWRDIQAARVLTPREAAVLQELCAWREEAARKLDQPARFILGDGILTELARRQPLTLESLAANRRISPSLVKKRGLEILDRIQRAARRPEWAWPRPVADSSAEGRIARWLRTWAFASGHAHAWAADLVLPDRLAEDLATDRPPTRELLANQLGPWRDTLIGDDLWLALGGRIGLRAGVDLEIVDDDPAQRDG